MDTSNIIGTGVKVLTISLYALALAAFAAALVLGVTIQSALRRRAARV